MIINKKNIKKIIVVAVCFVMPLLCGFSVFAKTSDSELMKKTFANGLMRCLSSTYMKDGKTDGIVAASIYGVSDLMVGSSDSFGSGSGGYADGIIKVPSKFGNTLKDDDISCYQLFEGWSGLFSGKINGLLTGSQLKKENLLEKMGYIETTEGDDSICVEYEYYLKGSTNKTNKLCYKVENNKLVSASSSNDWSGKVGPFYLSSIHTAYGVELVNEDLECSDGFAGYFCSELSVFSPSAGMTVDEFTTAAQNGGSAFNEAKWDIGGNTGSKFKSVNIAPNNVFKRWAIDNWSNVQDRAIANLTPYSNRNEIEFTDQDKYDLYTGYLFSDNSVYSLYVIGDTCSDSKYSSNQSIPIISSGEVKWCELGGDLQSTKKVNILAITGRRFLDVSGGPYDVIAALRALDVTNLELAAADLDTGEVETPVEITTPEGGENDACYDGSGALGWLICPIVKAATGIGEHMWAQIEEKHMKMPAKEIFKSGGGVQKTWEVVRNIANILFIVLFLFVIFSQLTGVGIDNYGIKKILPKLIVTAILINLSYIICELAVDVSNILGVGLNSMLSSAASGVAGAGASVSSQIGGWTVTALLGAGAGAIFVWFSGGLALAALSAGLAVLGFIISLVVAMFFLYLTLIIREAGVILAVVLSPVALACYMLPNTEKYYKKWFDIFKALLIVYPLCGALVGAGQLAGAVLSSIDGMGVAAMLVQVLPFFLIPTLLRNSLSLLGNVGAKLSAAGRSFGRRSSSAMKNGIRNTAQVKDWSRYQQDRQSTRRAERIRNRLSGRTDLSDRQKNQLREAEDVMVNDTRRRNENDRRVSGVNYDARIAAANEEVQQQQSKDRTTLAMANSAGRGMEQLMHDWNTAFDSGNADDLDAITNVITQRYGAAGVNQIASALNGKTGIAGNVNYQASMQTLQRTMNNNSNFAGFMRSKASDAYQMISDAGMRYNSATGQMVHEDMSYFSAHNETATAAKDWATASRATLQRGVESGALDEQMIRTLLTSEDPAIKSGLGSERGKTDVLEGALYNIEHGGTVGPILPTNMAAQRYRDEQASIQDETEISISHERDAERIGKTTITVSPGSVITSTPAVTFEGYATPAGFNTGGVAPVQNADGHWIYRDATTNREWNATTGRYMPRRPTPPTPPTPTP